MNFRLYTFVANHYLSPLQCGLQTAHVVSELSSCGFSFSSQRETYEQWAAKDKTIIICGAGNHQGVLDCHAELMRTGDALGLPVALFREDEQSMNGMATACGVIVPQRYWDVTFEDGIENGLGFPSWVHSQLVYLDSGPPTVLAVIRYPLTHPEGQFIDHIKRYRLA